MAAPPHLSKKQLIYLLRWLLIIASAYLFLFTTETEIPPPALSSLIAVVLLSNLLLPYFPERWIEKPAFDIAVVLFDTLWVSLGAALTGNLAGDFFLLYFLIVLLAVAGEHLWVIVCAAAIIGVTYVATVAYESSSSILTSQQLLRVPFLFAVALFYGYMVTRTREEHLLAKLAQEREGWKTHLISTVSHELRTPLTSLRGFTELMLRRHFPPEKQRELLTIVHDESIRLNDLINDFLDIQRIESGRQTYKFASVDIVPLLRKCAVSFFPLDEQHTLRFEVPDSPPPVWADESSIHQVLSNLLSNAVKFSPHGGAVSVGARQEGKDVVVWVADQGVGIPPDDIPKLFSKFFRVENKDMVNIRGTGLGLALIKDIVEAHKGRVWVESKLGEGSTFFFTLPAAKRAP